MTSLYVICDSYGQTTPNFAAVMAARLGYTLTLDAQGGTSYFFGGAGHTFRERVPAAVAANPDIVMVAGSVNDRWETPASVAAEALLTWAALAAIPKRYAALFCTSDGWANCGPTTMAPYAVALAAAAKSVGVIFISGVGWIAGTGTVAAPTGDGNGDVYAAADDVHPTGTGGSYLGTRLAFAISPPSTGLDY